MFSSAPLRHIFSSALIMLSAVLMLTNCSREDSYVDEADRLTHEFILVDGHVDFPIQAQMTDEKPLSPVENDGDFDYQKAVDGGLNAPFMSIYVPSRLQQTGGAMAFADSLISIVEQMAADHPDNYALATSPQEIEQQFKDGKISLPMGLENGAPIGNDLQNVQRLYDKGIRYITLTHAKDNQISDSSYDTTQTHGGLSPFGQQVVQKMNQVGMMVDISHVSDSAFFDVMETTQAPVIASHSSVRYFTPDFERNASDTMITSIAKNEGIIMINFGSDFISDSSRVSSDSLDAHIERWLEDNEMERSDPEAQEYIEGYRAQNYYRATVSDVADHFDYVANLAGIDYVGIGSDFDGVGDTLPDNLSNVSMYPNLIRELMDRGYTKDDIRKITHENIFRIWNEVEATAQRLSRNASN